MKRINLHNHTTFSDGSYCISEIINAAIQANLDQIGISDHYFTSKIFRGWSYEHWYNNKWKEYIRQLDILVDKYSNEISVLKGIEIDSCEDRLQRDVNKLPWKELSENLDYVLIEYVGEYNRGGMPIDKLKEIRNLTDMPIIFAHPDIDSLNYTLPIDRLFGILRELNIAIEIPAGFRNSWYWNKYNPDLLQNMELSIGSDTHRDISEVGNIDKTLMFLDENNLSKQILNLKGEGTR